MALRTPRVISEETLTSSDSKYRLNLLCSLIKTPRQVCSRRKVASTSESTSRARCVMVSQKLATRSRCKASTRSSQKTSSWCNFSISSSNNSNRSIFIRTAQVASNCRSFSIGSTLRRLKGMLLAGVVNLRNLIESQQQE